MNALLVENRGEYEKHEKLLSIQATTITDKIGEQLIEELHNVQETNATLLTQALKKIESKTLQRLDTYLNEEKQDLTNWVSAINTSHNTTESIERIESAMNKYPGVKVLFVKFQEEITPLLSSENQVIKKHAIERYNGQARLFSDNCRSEDWSFANDALEQSLQLGNQFMIDVQNTRHSNLKNKIFNLELLSTLTKSNTELSTVSIEVIEKADKEIDKKLFDSYPELKARYNKVSQQFIAYFTPSHEDEKTIKEYNLTALSDFHTALTLFHSNENAFKSGASIHLLIEKLGGWKSEHLASPTQVYFQNVYSEIFSKLNPNVKVEFSKAMLNAPRKEVIPDELPF